VESVVWWPRFKSSRINIHEKVAMQRFSVGMQWATFDWIDLNYWMGFHISLIGVM